MIIWQKIAMFIIGSGFGFIIGEIVFYKPLYKDYKKWYEEYYEKWYNLHRRACEAWHLLKDKKADKAFFELDMYYGDNK